MDELLKGGSSIPWFIVLFMPGFVSVKVYGLLISTDRPDFSKDFFSAVAYSILNFAVFLPFLWLAIANGWFSDFGVVLGASYVVLLVAPALWAWLFVMACEKGWLPFINQALHPKAWDYFFSQERSLWVVAYLDDESRVGGIFSTKSYASSYPYEEQVLLEQQWLLDENDAFVAAVPRSAGVIINARDIKRIEFYE